MANFPNYLFRYSKRNHLDSFLAHGQICLHPASYYKDSALTNPQQDDELVRQSSPDAAHHRVAVGDRANMVSDLGSLTKIAISYKIKTQEGHFYDYYIFCTSMIHSLELYKDFGANACVLIRNPPEFWNRLLEACNKEFGAHRSFCSEVTYFDRLKPLRVEKNLDLVFHKDAQTYSHQKEYRFAICLDPAIKLSQDRVIELGQLSDIAQYNEG